MPDEFLFALGRLVVVVGRLDGAVCHVAGLLGVVDPALLSTAVALRKARRQAEASMPPWARVEAASLFDWIDGVLAILPLRNAIYHWPVYGGPFASDETTADVTIGFYDPHDLIYLPTGADHIDAVRARAHRLCEDSKALIDGLCFLTDEGSLIDPMSSLDGLGTGDLGFYMGINEDWPEEQPRKLGGKPRKVVPQDVEPWA